MRLIQLSSRPNNDDWGMKFVDEKDADEILSEDVRVLKPDGSPLLVLLKNAISQQSLGRAWPILKKLNLITKNRGLASGRPTEPYKRKDGTLSKTLDSAKGWEVESGIIGYFERTVRLPFCRACAWNQKNPEKFAQLLPMIREVDGMFASHIPDRYAVQKSYAERTSKDFLIPGTAFTTLTVNKNFRTACHKDAGDLEKGFSCLSVFRQGVYQGGNLILPNWRIGAKLETGDVIMFDAHEYHGNTQIVPLSSDALRCSIVYYFREAMVKCKSSLEELETVKKRKPGDPLWESE